MPSRAQAMALGGSVTLKLEGRSFPYWKVHMPAYIESLSHHLQTKELKIEVLLMLLLGFSEGVA